MNNTIYPILTYHSISTPPKHTAIKSLCVTKKSFHRQMFLLKTLGFKVVSIKELIPYLQGKKVGKVIGLTLDDGYADNLEHALPILKKYGFSATCYIVTDLIDNYNTWDLSKNVAKRKLMNTNELQKWSDAGFELGCHSATHIDLTTCDQDRLKYEIVNSKKTLENILKISIENFCYPYGKFNPVIANTVKQAGFSSATSTIRSRANVNDDLYALPRINIARRTTLLQYIIKIFSKYEDNRKLK